MTRLIRVSVIAFIVLFSYTAESNIIDNSVDECNVPQELKDEIKAYQSKVDIIIDWVTNGKYKGSTYDILSNFVDTYGPRFTGTKILDNAIDGVVKVAKTNKFGSVHTEDVTAPHWVRGNEYAEMLEPRYQNIPMLGLGYSVGTPENGIEAEVVVVKSFDELDQIGNEAKGKIVVYNQDWVGYGETARYRSLGADHAAKYGAVAALIRSITPFSLRTPHTGMMDYEGNVTKIPGVCISVEDAHMLHRRYVRGEKITIRLKMDAKMLPDIITRNTIIDINGAKKPDEIVVISGHLDSWDVTDGAMDDGAAAIMTLNTIRILQDMKLIPQRTLRAILWSGEEMGLLGAHSYVERHKDEMNKFKFVMESDEGTFTPQGLIFAGNDEAACVLQEILNLFTSINTTTLTRGDRVGSDIVAFPHEIPAASLMNKNENYFWYHHTAADTLDVEDPATLDKCTALWTAVSYIIADISYEWPLNK